MKEIKEINSTIELNIEILTDGTDYTASLNEDKIMYSMVVQGKSIEEVKREIKKSLECATLYERLENTSFRRFIPIRINKGQSSLSIVIFGIGFNFVILSQRLKDLYKNELKTPKGAIDILYLRIFPINWWTIYREFVKKHVKK